MTYIQTRRSTDEHRPKCLNSRCANPLWAALFGWIPRLHRRLHNCRNLSALTRLHDKDLKDLGLSQRNLPSLATMPLSADIMTMLSLRANGGTRNN